MCDLNDECNYELTHHYCKVMLVGRGTALLAFLRSAANIVNQFTVEIVATVKCMYVRERGAIEPIVVDRGLIMTTGALMEIGIVQSMSGYMKRVTGIHFASIVSPVTFRHPPIRRSTQGTADIIHECMLC